MIFHGYYVVTATFALSVVAIGVFNASGLFLVPLLQTFEGANSAMVSLFPTIQLGVGLCASLGAGYVQEFITNHGWTMEPFFASGGVFLALGLFWSSVAKSLSAVLLGGAITGIGVGCTGFTAPGVCVLWFNESRGTMLLLALSGQGLGCIFYSIGLQKLLEMFEDYEDPWRPAMRWLGILSLVLVLLASAAMRLPNLGEVEMHEGAEAVVDNGDTGRITNGYGSIEDEPGNAFKVLSRASRRSRLRRSSVRALSRSISRRSVVCQESLIDVKKPRRRNTFAEFTALTHMAVNYGADDEEETDFGADVPSSLRLQQVGYSKTSLSLFWWFVIGSFSYLNFNVHVAPYALSVGLSPAVGAQAIGLLGLGVLMANLTLGGITDMIGAIQILRITMAILVALIFIWPYCKSQMSLWVLSACYGYVCSTQGSVPLIILADAFGETSPDSVLILNGVMNGAKVPGYLLGPSIAGLLFESSQNYHSAALCTGAVMLVANLFLFLIPPAKEQKSRLQQFLLPPTEAVLA